MSSIKNFEELIAWQKARLLNQKVYSVSNSGSFNKDFALRDQIRRAGISILSNIAEGFDRNGSKEFIHFLSIAKASAAELKAQLYVAIDLEYINKSQFDEIFSLAVETSKLIGGLIKYLQASDLKGSKFMEDTTNYEL